MSGIYAMQRANSDWFAIDDHGRFRVPMANSPTPATFDAIRWAQLNPWLTEGQADDRRPMIGSVAHGNGTPSARRALARRSHQVNYKEWSKARHD